MKILKLEESNSAPLKCVLSVCIEKWGNFVIEEIKLFESGAKKWVQFPSRQYEKDGVKKNFQYNRFLDKTNIENFNRKLFLAADEFIMKQRKEINESANKA